MKILVVGNGAREHALCWKIKQSPLVSELLCAPGNPGISQVARCERVAVDDVEGLRALALKEKIDLTIVGPERPLDCGLVDAFQSAGLLVFGPKKAAARLESSKAFAKEVMVAAGVPTAGYHVCASREEAKGVVRQTGRGYVVKVDGLAAGKGVIVARTIDETLHAIDAVFDEFSPSKVVLEEFLEGVEASFIIATDGTHIVPLLPAHDYKRLGEGDAGPNTGGMGSVCPTPRIEPKSIPALVESIVHPVLREMKHRGTPFHGFLYAGLMLDTNGSPQVLEFNVRLGDPEAQSILRMLKSDIVPLLRDLAGGVGPAPLEWHQGHSVCIVHAAEGYPGTPRKGDLIEGIPLIRSLSEVQLFCAGVGSTARGELVTDGGRVLSVTARDSSLEGARRLALRASDLVQFRGRQMRRDIGL
ncbi:MAG: phosphoribosylamine--glycine ligase [Bdellovibrionota bacterium]|nr:MAG: phosphoribosylamine--glycine ligase [Bdellovibrionota bacterium]